MEKIFAMFFSSKHFVLCDKLNIFTRYIIYVVIVDKKKCKHSNIYKDYIYEGQQWIRLFE